MGASGGRRVLVPSGDDLGESPVWDPRTGTVAWIDASEASVLHRLDWRTGAHSRYPLATRCTAIGLGPVPDVYAAALGDGVGLLDSHGLLLEKVGLGAGPSGALTNDGACSPDGAFWFGTTTRSRQPLAGTLWRYDGGGITPVATGYTLSNGIAWLEDGETFYHVDTLEHIVRRDKWDPGQGHLDEEVFLTFAEEDGLPDGIALDIEGGLWIAFWGTGAVRRYDPDGHVDHEIRFPVPNVTAVAFAGDDLTTLVVTSARSTQDGVPADGSGHLYACDAGVPGLAPMIHHAGARTPRSVRGPARRGEERA